MAEPRAEQITSYLALFGSHERALPLWVQTADEPAEVFLAGHHRELVDLRRAMAPA